LETAPAKGRHVPELRSKVQRLAPTDYGLAPFVYPVFTQEVGSQGSVRHCQRPVLWASPPPANCSHEGGFRNSVFRMSDCLRDLECLLLFVDA
jgi:hypothetical protein